MSEIKIREIKPKYNLAVNYLTQKVLIEFSALKTDTDCQDVTLLDIYNTYNAKNRMYFALKINDVIVDRADIKILNNCTTYMIAKL